jgi:hypothetical protein
MSPFFIGNLSRLFSVLMDSVDTKSSMLHVTLIP